MYLDIQVGIHKTQAAELGQQYAGSALARAWHADEAYGVRAFGGGCAQNGAPVAEEAAIIRAPSASANTGAALRRFAALVRVATIWILPLPAKD
jgi:hypothetical protein